MYFSAEHEQTGSHLRSCMHFDSCSSSEQNTNWTAAVAAAAWADLDVDDTNSEVALIVDFVWDMVVAFRLDLETSHKLSVRRLLAAIADTHRHMIVDCSAGCSPFDSIAGPRRSKALFANGRKFEMYSCT